MKKGTHWKDNFNRDQEETNQHKMRQTKLRRDWECERWGMNRIIHYQCKWCKYSFEFVWLNTFLFIQSFSTMCS